MRPFLVCAACHALVPAEEWPTHVEAHRQEETMTTSDLVYLIKAAAVLVVGAWALSRCG